MTTTNGKRPALCDRQAVADAVRRLVGDGNVTELRALEATTADDRYPRTLFGYFDDPVTLADAGATIKTAKGVYIVPNAVNPALLARAANRIKVAGKGDSTQDTDIIRRRWLLVDCDPQRPGNISASDAEHEAARQRTRDIFAYLQSLGWPQPIAADSGNGAHLAYRVDLPTDDGGMVQRCLQALAQRFNDAVVKVDESVFNPARIWKLYGTLACKGDDTPDRPWRMSRVLHAPDDLQAVPIELLEALAAEVAAPQSAGKTTAHEVNGQSFDVADFLQQHGLDVDGPNDWNQGRGRVWTFRQSPMCEHHGDGPHIEQHESGAISAGCHHNSCAWTWQDLRAKYEPRQLAAPRNGKPKSAGDTDEKKSQATRLVDLAAAAELWHSPGHGDGYATINVDGHSEHWPIRGKAFRRWLARRFFCEYKKAPGGQALQNAITVIEGQALFDGDELFTAVRVAQHEHRLYLDLADPQWRAVEIDTAGWRVVDVSPVRFRRARAMHALPEPTAGGRIDDLRQYVNVTEDDWPLLLGWLVAALRPAGPYPILALHGEQGSAKTTTARVLRALIDPNAAPVRCEPREPRDLMIAANNGWVVAMDNLSHIRGWLSDALCRLATGGGFSTRTLYENDEETIFDATRPVILTGIEEVATRADLLDRCLIVSLPVIPESQRKPESQFWRDFYEAQPSILGAVLSAAAVALRELPSVRLDRLPRMADFALWATAAESGLGLPSGGFMAAYTDNRRSANEHALESSPVATHVIDLARQRQEWNGTPGELLDTLDGMATDKCKATRGWPKSPRGLSGILRRLAPNLRAAGVDIGFTRATDRGRQRRIEIRLKQESSVRTVQPSDDDDDAASGGDAGQDVARPGEADAADGCGRTRDDCRCESDANEIDANPETARVRTVADGSDATIPVCSNDDGWGEV